jgi:hypothetical protein
MSQTANLLISRPRYRNRKYRDLTLRGKCPTKRQSGMCEVDIFGAQATGGMKMFFSRAIALS